MIRPVLPEPNKILRKIAEEVPLAEIFSPKIKKLLKDMSDTLHSIDIGIGLAAPQIGESVRIFLISEEVLRTKRDREKLDIEELRRNKKQKKWRHFVFINPKIIKTFKKKELLPEGCLSVPDLYGEVERFEKLTVEAYDEHGRKFRRHALGLFTQVIQHETDHLNGVLFIDKAKEVYKIKNE